MTWHRQRVAIGVSLAFLVACGGGGGTQLPGPSFPSASNPSTGSPTAAASPSALPSSAPSTHPSPRPSVTISPAPTATASTGPAPSATPLPARRAAASDAFVDSIGVNTHFSYAGSVYDATQAEQALEALHVRHVRDVFPDASQAARFADVAPYGIRFDSIWQIGLFSGPVASWNPTPDGYASTVGASNFDSYEGTNENNQSCTGNAAWASQTRAQQTSLYAYMQSHGLSALPLLAPAYGTCVSFTALIADANAMGSLAAASTLGNVHWYPAPIANFPEDSCLDAAQAAVCSGNFWLEVAQIENPGQPVVVGETGAESAGGGCQKNSGPIGQERYDLRLLLNDWNVGVTKTYLFELLDDYHNDGCYFGLLNDSYVAKPAYSAVQNLIAVLADPGYTSFAAGSLQYALGGNLTNVESVLLEKHTGTFELVLWQAVASVDGNGNPLPVAPQTVTLTFPAGPTSLGAQTFTNSGALSPVSVASTNHVVTLPVTDSPVIVTIVP